MSSKAVELTMGDSCYQASDKTTMSQRQVTWGSRLMYLLGLLVCFMCVWYLTKLQTEVTVMKSQLEENTRQITKLHYLCKEHAAAGDNSDDLDLDDEVVDESTEENSDEEGKLDIEVELEFEPGLGESDVYEERQAIDALEIADRLAGDIADNKIASGMSKRAKRSVHQEESSPSPGRTTKKPRNRDCCKRSCKHKKDCCGHCKEEKTPVASAHFVGDATTVASVDRHTANPAMANVDGLISHWRHAHWMHSPQKAMFNLSMTGNVTVQKAGIYFIYSQVQYYDENDFTGHSIVVNGEKFVSCIECPVDSYRKFSTCYIGGVTHLQENSQVGLKVTRPTIIRLRPDTSYFGLIKLG